MMKTGINVTESILKLSVPKHSFTRKLIQEAFILGLICFFLYQLPIDRIAADYPITRLVYLLPLVRARSVWKVFQQFLREEEFVFDKSTDELTHNLKRKVFLTDINQVVLKYQIEYEDEKVYLALIVHESGMIKINQVSSKQILIEQGIAIAKFLNVAFVDDYPYRQEVLWGSADVSSSDIRIINNSSL